MLSKLIYFVILGCCVSHPHDIPVHFEPLSDDIIEYVNNLKTTWKAGYNLEGATPLYLKGLLGTIMYDESAPSLPGKMLLQIFYA